MRNANKLSTNQGVTIRQHIEQFMFSSSSKEKSYKLLLYMRWLWCVGIPVCEGTMCLQLNRCDSRYHFCQSISHSLSERKKYVVNKCDWIMRFSFCRIDRLTIRSNGFFVCANNASVHGSLHCTPVHAWHGATERLISIVENKHINFVNDSQSPVKKTDAKTISTQMHNEAWPLGSDVPFEIT